MLIIVPTIVPTAIIIVPTTLIIVPIIVRRLFSCPKSGSQQWEGFNTERSYIRLVTAI